MHVGEYVVALYFSRGRIHTPNETTASTILGRYFY